MRGIGKAVVPALIVLVMVVGAFGTLVTPRSSPEATGGQVQTQTPSTRGGSIPSALSGPAAGPAGNSGSVSEDPVSGVVMNKAIFGRTDMTPEPWQVPTKPSGLSFTSIQAPTSTVLRSDPTPTSMSVDAGGPYGGPTTFEGDTVLFTATVDDPSLIFFRWDFNGDGKWDTGTAATGNWIPDTTVAYTYRNMFDGLATVQAWDGVSTTTVSYTGNILGTTTPAYYGFIYGAYTIGNRYQAKRDFTITDLRAYRWTTYWTPVEMGLWSDGGALLGSCTLPTANPSWNSCSITPVSITSGSNFRVAVRISTGYWMGDLMSSFPSNPIATTDGSYYSGTTGSSLIFPVYLLTTAYTTHIDFAWSYQVVTPLTVSDTAKVSVQNVAPVVFDLAATPVSVNEGSFAKFHAMFYDPGLDEQWTYRWCYGDGTCDDWGGIKVGSGLSQLPNILVYSDVAPHYAAQALDYFGVKYTLTTDIFALPTLIASKQWDLFIYQSYYIAYVAPTVEDAMMNLVKTHGTLLMYNNWYANNRLTHPIMAYFGVSALTTYTTPVPMYAWDPTNDVFNTPTQTPLVFHPTHDQYFTDGFRAKLTSVAFAPLGYTSNQQASQAAMVVRNDKGSIFNTFTPQNFQGDENYDGDPDMLQLLVNEIRLLTGPEIPRTMPWPVPEAKHAYRDVPAEGVFQASVTATLEVKDSNDGKLQGGSTDSVENFASCSPWPNGWFESQGFAWQCGYSTYLASNGAIYWYYYDYSSNWHRLESRQYDLSVMDMSAPTKRVTVSFRQSWQANYPLAQFQDGFVDVSADNFATYTTVWEGHHLNPANELATHTYDISQFAGVSNLRVRFSIRGYDDYWWHVSNVEIYAEWGTRVDGTGSGSTQVTVVNVPPTIYGGPSSFTGNEADLVALKGYKISDPTLINPTTGTFDPVSTEWFAYRWNFDDGTMSPWTYTGSLALPKLKILVLNTLSFGTGDSFLALIRGIDIVSQVDSVDFLYMSPSQLPTLAQMEGYDAIILATNYAIFSSTFDLTRQAIGDRLAAYMDAKPNAAVITFMATYDLSPYYGELFTMLGRYMDDSYGSFVKTTYLFQAAALGQVLQPDHPVMKGVTRLTSPLISSGDYPLTSGAQLLARWDDGNAAIGVKERPNGARTVNIGGFSASGSSVCGGDCATLIRNSIVWASHTVVPTNDIPALNHNWGDNGVYNVELMILDDNMGWSWDAASQQPVAIQGLQQTMTHYVVPVNVNNVDPTIQRNSIEAFIAADVCLRVSGDTWNTVSLGFFVDGVKKAADTVTRAPGSPNDQAKCGFVKIDVLAKHTFTTQVDYAPAAGDTSGTNDWWVIIAPWKTPITPGHGTVTVKGAFSVQDPSSYTASISMPTLKADLLDQGRGAPIEFAATAFDPGTDDLAFAWTWGDGTPDTVNVHNNKDGSVTTGVVGNPQYVGFSEPYFNRAADTGRSPYGTIDFTARDFATHAFGTTSQYLWIMLLVLDDDNTRGYVSHFGHDGTDQEFIVVDLT